MSLKNPGAITVGMRMRDNDPRYGGRIVEIMEVHRMSSVLCDVTWYGAKDRHYTVKADRLHDDGKSRHQGWTIISVPKPAVEGYDMGRPLATMNA